MEFLVHKEFFVFATKWWALAYVPTTLIVERKYNNDAIILRRFVTWCNLSCRVLIITSFSILIARSSQAAEYREYCIRHNTIAQQSYSFRACAPYVSLMLLRPMNAAQLRTGVTVWVFFGYPVPHETLGWVADTGAYILVTTERKSMHMTSIPEYTWKRTHFLRIKKQCRLHKVLWCPQVR